MTPSLPRICFLTGTLNAMAGAERMTATIANALAERGHAVSILSLWDASSCFALHPAVRHEAIFDQRPSFKSRYVATVAAIRRHVKRHRIDVLVQVDTMLALFTIPATLGLGIRQIAWEHCHFDEDLGKPMRRHARRIAARTCQDVVVLTERDRQRWIDALQPRSRVTCIPNPIPFPIPLDAAARTGKIVLAVGRLVRAKGFDILLQAWSTVTVQAPDWRLVIVGEGEERNALESLCTSLGIASTVSLPGATSDITAAYREASLFCMSSRYEGFGLVLVEAMAFGLPIVSTYCEAGPRELLTPDLDALTVPVDDAAALAAALLRLMNHSDTAETLARHARQTARKYAPDDVMTAWTLLLNTTQVCIRCKNS